MSDERRERPEQQQASDIGWGMSSAEKLNNDTLAALTPSNEVSKHKRHRVELMLCCCGTRRSRRRRRLSTNCNSPFMNHLLDCSRELHTVHNISFLSSWRGLLCDFYASPTSSSSSSAAQSWIYYLCTNLCSLSSSFFFLLFFFVWLSCALLSIFLILPPPLLFSVLLLAFQV